MNTTQYDWMFKIGDCVKHKKSGKFYTIFCIGHTEKDEKPCYVYGSTSFSNVWVRGKESMEDGRFVLNV